MKKRLLSLLLALTMLASLIPSTLVSAFAEEAHVAPLAGKTKLELTNQWPLDTQVGAYDIIDITLSNTINPGTAVTVEKGKTVIVHGSGTISGAGISLTNKAPIFTVEDGGTLVLDGVKIASYMNAGGAVYVKSGGLLDLGYNDQKARTAPSINGNTGTDGNARNLVIEDGATVRLNAEAKQAIGVSYAGNIKEVAPVSVIEGGRYTIRGDQDTLTNKETMITPDDTTNAKIVYSYDNLVLRYAKERILFWDPTYSFGWAYRSDSNKQVDIVNTLLPWHQVGSGRNWFKDWTNAEVTIVSPLSTNAGTNWNNRKSFVNGTDRDGKSVGNIEKYDFIYIIPSVRYKSANNHDGTTNVYTDEEINALRSYLDKGGRIFIQCENGYFTYLNQSATVLAQALGTDFTITTDPVGTESATSNTESKLIKGSETVYTTWNVLNASLITYEENDQATWLFKATKTNKVFGVDLMAGSTTTGVPWGSITVVSDVNLWSNGGVVNNVNTNWQTQVGKPFMINLLKNTAQNRATAAAGVNPNEQIVPQAKVTTTTTEYRTVSAALGKITENQTAQVVRYSDNTSYTPVENELLFENATLTDLWGNSIYAETSGVYIDMSRKMHFNVQSGTVKINKTQDTSFANSDFNVYLGATLNADKSDYTGGIKLSSKSSFILCADDPDSPISQSANGPGSITIPSVGQTVKVTYPGGGVVEYTAKVANEKFYLGKYTVLNAVSGNAVTDTTSKHPHHGQDYTQTYTPAVGYELNGGNFRVVMMNKEGSLSSVVVNMKRSDADSVDGQKIVYKSSQTSYSDTYGSIGQVTVTENFTNGVCTSVDVKVEDVRSHIKIYTEGDSAGKLAPTIMVVGEGTDKNGDKQELYNLNTTMSYYDGQSTKPVKFIDWSKYRLVGVKVAKTPEDGNAPADNAYTTYDLKDASGNVNADAAQNIYCYVDLTQGNQYVKFIYEWNWVEVNVKAQYADGTEIPGAGRKDDMEAGKEQDVAAPTVPGYQPDAGSKKITPNANGTNEVVFTYTQITSTVELIAVDEAGHELTRVAGPTIAKGGTVDTAKIVAPTLPGYTLKQGVDPTVTGSPYDGVNNPTVTYTYTASKKTLTVKAYVYDATKGDYKGDILKEDSTSYKDMTPGQTLNVTAPAIAGYKVKVDAANDELKEVKSVYLTDDANAQEVVFFYEADPNNSITVKLVDDKGKELGGYTIPGVAGQKQLITAPTLQGYTVDKNSISIAPDGDEGDGTGVAKFTYTKNIWTVTVKLMDSSKNPAEDISAKAPANYPTSIEVIKGESVSITAPSIYGYSLAENQAAVISVTPNQNETVTINYIPVDKSLVTITIIDKLDTNGTVTEFMTRTETVTAGTTEKVISMLSIPGYKLTSAKIDTVEKIDTVNNNSLTVHTQTAGQGKTIQVVLTHTYNKVNVTVEAKFDGKVLGSYTLPLDKGVPAQVFPPVVEGYTATETSKNFTPSDTNTTVTFTLAKSKGNVTLIVVDAEGGTELTRKDGGTVNKGDNITLANFANNLPTIEFYEKSAGNPEIKVGTTPKNDGDAYDGSADITVTYTYERKKQSITVIKKDFDTKGQIETQNIDNLPVGKEHSFNDTVTVPSGYQAVATNPTTYYVKDTANQTVEFFYKSTKTEDYVSVTVKLINDTTNEVFQSYPVSNLRKGVATTVTAPTPKGYKLATGQTQTKNITPDGTADNDVVEFRYTVENPKTLTVELKNNTDSSKLPTPDNYTLTYTLKEGDEVTVTAPAISGYSLMSAALDNQAQQNSQVVTVSYDQLKDSGSTLVFSYYPVTQANFVTHTIKFMVGNNTLYTHDKMIAKGDGATVPYSEADVKYSVPGYAFDHIDYKLGDQTATADQVTNAVNATIIYHFTEDAATITIKKVEKGTNTAIGTDEALTGYRKGQTVKVVAPHVEGKVLVGDLIKTVDLNTAGNTDVTFEYVNAGQVTLTLREKDGNIIKVISPESTKTYTAGQGDLDLSANGWTYSAADTANVFDGNNQLQITDLQTTKNYDIYYIKQTRKVTFIAVDKDKLGNTDIESAPQSAIIESKENVDTARVGESYKAVAQSFNGYNLKDQISKVYDVQASTDPLKVYFLYEVKASGSVSVHYHYGDKHAVGTLLNQYTVNAAVGETVTVTAPAELESGKYKLSGGQDNPRVVSVTEGDTTVEFYYEANFWTVDVKTVLDDGAAGEHEKHEVVKGQSVTVYPPNKADYTLVGITGAGTNGAADKLPTDYTDNKLTVTPSADTTVTYYYAKTTADQFQSTVTVEYKYNGYDLKASTTVQANKGKANTIAVPDFEGYTASTYTYVDGTNEKVKNSGIGNSGISINPEAAIGTVTITYTRTDNSVVLPGKDDKLDAPDHDKDNVTVKPDGSGKIDLVDTPEKGSAKVDDTDGATVTRPTDPNNPDNGKDNIKVPDGTIIKPDGTIILPDNGGEIKPTDKLPDNTPSNYITVTYKPNGGVGEEIKQVVKTADAKAMANPFTGYNGATFTGWNTEEHGTGTAYAVNDKLAVANGKGITLYAQWGKAGYTHSATIIYDPNGASGQSITETVGSNDKTTFSVKLNANTFTLAGWSFGGWNEEKNGSGTLYQAGGAYTLKEGDIKTLYAQWYRIHDDGSITVPGKDGNPNTEQDNATANGNGTENPTRDPDTGSITIPAGGSVTKDGETIVLPDGGILKPDGTIIINRPDGNGDQKPDGGITVPGTDGTNPDVTDKDDKPDNSAKVVTLTYTVNNGESDEVKVYAVSGDRVKAIANPFTWEGHIFLNWMEVGTNPVKEHAVGTEITVGAQDMEFHAQWAKKNTDGSVELPGKDGILEDPHEKDNVTVKPDGDNGKIEPQPDGSVKVEDQDGGTVTRPDPEDNTGNKKEDVKVPDGTIVKPDGTIILPDNGGEIKPGDNLPEKLPSSDKYIVVTYEPGIGSGDVIKQIVKKGDMLTAMKNPFVAATMTFDGWRSGDTDYKVGDTLPTDSNLTLIAQWKAGQAARYTATIIFHSNTEVANKTQIIGSADSSTITAKLENNTFAAPDGWSFMGWSTKQNGTAGGDFYKDNADVTLKDKEMLELYAIWYKQDGNNIVLPGKDGKADTSDDLTVKPGNGTAPIVKKDNGEGYVEAASGNEIEKRDPSGTIKVIDGPVQVYPDGTIKVPEGSKVEMPDGSTVEGPATIDPDNTVDKDSDDKPRKDNDGNIILPGKDGKLDDPYDKDNVTVIPGKDDNGDDKSTIDPDGKVNLPDGGTVKYPDKTEVEAPDGSIVHPDGTIEFPDTDESGSIKPDGGTETPIPGGSTVDPDGIVTYRYTVKFSGVTRADDHVMVKSGISYTYYAPHFNGYTVNQQSATIVGGTQPFTVIFTYTQGSTTPPSGGSSGGITIASYIITATAGQGGSISPDGKTTVTSGSDKAFTISPNNGYRVKDVLVDGKSVGAVDIYVFEKVTSNHTISVTFEAAKPAANSGLADPEDTGVSQWLRYTDHSAYMNGYGDGQFGARDDLNRAQAAQMFYNLLVNPNVEITVSFVDVPADAWYATAVNTLASLGIVNGVGDNRFEPERSITRAEFTAMATRFAKATEKMTISPFDDVSTEAWFFGCVVTAVSYGWIDGYGNGMFGPMDNINRAQAVTIVNRMLARSADREFVGANSALKQFSDVAEKDWFYYQVMEATNGHNHGYSADGYEIWTKLQK